MGMGWGPRNISDGSQANVGMGRRPPRVMPDQVVGPWTSQMVPELPWGWVGDPGTSEMVPKPTWGWEEVTVGHPASWGAVVTPGWSPQRIREGSVIDRIPVIGVGDMIEAIDGRSLVGARHYEVAKMLKELPRGRTFALQLTEPRKAFGEPQLGALGGLGESPWDMGSPPMGGVPPPGQPPHLWGLGGTQVSRGGGTHASGTLLSPIPGWRVVLGVTGSTGRTGGVPVGYSGSPVGGVPPPRQPPHLWGWGDPGVRTLVSPILDWRVVLGVTGSTGRTGGVPVGYRGSPNGWAPHPRAATSLAGLGGPRCHGGDTQACGALVSPIPGWRVVLGVTGSTGSTTSKGGGADPGVRWYWGGDIPTAGTP